MNTAKIISKKKWIVYGRPVSVKIVENLIDDLTGRTLAGVYYHDNGSILINGSLSRDEQCKTILHELGHALMYRIGLNQTSISEDNHEIIVEAFSNFMFETL